MIGVLLVNLGSPEAPTTTAVRRYLREFLSDPYVIDINPVARWLLVNLIIAPFRAPRSAKAYRQIWRSDGSPLLFYSYGLDAGVTEQLGSGYAVELAMRYGKPSIERSWRRLCEQSVEEIRVLPLYPQYALSSTETVIHAVKRVAKATGSNIPYRILPEFFDHPGFIESFAAHGRPVLEQLKPDHVLFSFHGLPERHIRKTDPTGLHCLEITDCCTRDVEANQKCYRRQCFRTAELIAERLLLTPSHYSVTFQSRLGRTPWIRPYTDQVLAELPHQGIKRVAVFSPSFVADCLETLEELDIRGRALFLEAGGERFERIACPNLHPRWIAAVCEMVRKP